MPVHLLGGLTRDTIYIMTEPLNAEAVMSEDISAEVTASEDIFAEVIANEQVVATISEYDMTTVQNLTIRRGDSRTWTFTVKDQNDNVVDITGWYVWFTVKDDLDEDDSGALFQRKNTDAGGGDTEIEMSDPTNGEFKVYIVPSNTINATPKEYNYDAQVKSDMGKVYTASEGKFVVYPDVTRTYS